MGCLMNLLWLLLGGIFTAVEYRHSFWNANIEVGRTCFMAFR